MSFADSPSAARWGNEFRPCGTAYELCGSPIYIVARFPIVAHFPLNWPAAFRDL